MAILLAGEETQQRYTVMEAVVPPGGGPPRHVHHREDETFLVLAGEITFYVADQALVRKRGESLFGPRDVPHYFINTGTEEAVLLEIATPAGVELFFEAAGYPLASRADGPRPMTAADKQRMLALAPDFGIDILEPAQALRAAA